ncbi:hypothetical protein TrRE_jg1453, partial [Triparma retinervis]
MIRKYREEGKEENPEDEDGRDVKWTSSLLHRSISSGPNLTHAAVSKLNKKITRSLNSLGLSPS